MKWQGVFARVSPSCVEAALLSSAGSWQLVVSNVRMGFWTDRDRSVSCIYDLSVPRLAVPTPCKMNLQGEMRVSCQGLQCPHQGVPSGQQCQAVCHVAVLMFWWQAAVSG